MPEEEAPTPNNTPILSLPVSPSKKLADKISADWLWLSSAYNNAFSGSETALHENVVKTRSHVQAVVASASDVRTAAETSVTQLTQPSSATLSLKKRFLEFRRDYKQFLVAGIAVASIVPALSPVLRGSGSSKLGAARLALRNLVVGGGSAAVIFYPEAIFATAPAFAGVAKRVQEQVVLGPRSNAS